MVISLFEIIGAAGLVSIIIGILNKKRNIQNTLYIIGGLLLLTYSIYLKNIIFIVLQSVFTLAATYDLIKRKNKK